MQATPSKALTDHLGTYGLAEGVSLVVEAGAGGLNTSLLDQPLDLAWVSDDATFLTSVSGLPFLVGVERDGDGRVG